MVTHNPALEAHFDRCIFMRDGKVTTDNLFHFGGGVKNADS
jgi:ABC-type lipoprotein export system ATPase subunit